MPIPHDVSTPPEEILNFGSLVNAIQQTHAQSAAAMSRVVNVTLTLRNWVIGAYIVEYEMRGEDRAKYGDGLMTALANRLTDLQVSNCNSRQLYRYLRFFQLYPQIAGTLPPQLPPPTQRDRFDRIERPRANSGDTVPTIGSSRQKSG